MNYHAISKKSSILKKLTYKSLKIIFLRIYREPMFGFLAATKQLYEWYFPSVCPSVCPSHLFDYVPIVVWSQNFQELLPMT